MEKRLCLFVGIGLLGGAIAVSATSPPTPTSLTHSSASDNTSLLSSNLVTPSMVPIGGEGGGGHGGGTTPPSAAMTFFDRNVATKTVELDLSNGVIELVNVAQNKVTIQINGVPTVFTLDQVMLKQASGNASVAAANKAALIAELATPDFTARFKALTGAASTNMQTSMMNQATGVGASRDPRYPGLRINAMFQGLAAPDVSYAKNTTYSPTLLMASGGSTAFGCDLSWDCEMASMDWGPGGGGGGMNFYFYDQGGVFSNSDLPIFQRWQKDQCSAAEDDQTDSIEAVGLMVIACGAAETGFGALACAAAGGGLIKSMNRGADHSKHCLEKYPGPGNW